ncbi:MAG: ribosome rescue protein RqcH [Sulfolobales archaeon]|nr:ribosome rescue protein RqcH [Sulfolobales archaeon]
MARESMSSLDLHIWVRNHQDLLGQRVDNVYVAGEAVVLKLRGGGALLLEAGRRAHITSRTAALEVASRGVGAALKQHLRDEKIVALEQLGFDRVLKVSLGEYSLYVELLPRGFLVLTRGGKILAASSYATLRDRSIRPGEEYRPPPLQQLNPFSLGIEEIGKRVGTGKDLVRGLVRGLGLAGEVAEEVLHRAGIPGERAPSSVGGAELSRLREELAKVYEESLTGKGYVLLKEGKPVEATPFRPTRGEAAERTTFDEALDELFSQQVQRDEALEAERRKLEESLRRAQELERSYLEEAGRLRELAARLAANYELLERAVECSRRREACEGTRLLPDGSLEVSLGDLSFRVLRGEEAQEVLVRLYRQAGELEGKARRAREAIGEALRGMEELELKVRARELAARARSRKVQWFEKYRWSYTTNGFLAVGGRDASQNESVVKKLLGEKDAFLHADIQGGSAVVLMSKGEEREEDLLDAATLAACYSKAWKVGLASIDVYWVRGAQVSKSPPAGEYLKTGAFMIYGEKNYIRGVRLQLAIGIALDEEGNPLAIAGPEGVVKRLSLAYVVVVPGDMKIEEAAAKARERIAEVIEGKHIAMAVRTEEIADKLPGSSSVFRGQRGKGEGLPFR